MPTILSDLLKPALRAAGITTLAGTTPSTDQYTELIPAMNRFLESWSIDGLKVYHSAIVTKALTSGLKSYTIGSGGDFNTPRPIHIAEANVLYPTTPVLREPLHVTRNPIEWAALRIQDIDGAPPTLLYYDYAFTASLGKIYLYPQPPAGYTLELFNWLSLIGTAFAAITDSVVLPPGYEQAIVDNFALVVASLYPRDAVLAPDAHDRARKSLDAVKILNAKCRPLVSEYAAPSSGRSGYGWIDGT